MLHRHSQRPERAAGRYDNLTRKVVSRDVRVRADILIVVMLPAFTTPVAVTDVPTLRLPRLPPTVNAPAIEPPTVAFATFPVTLTDPVLATLPTLNVPVVSPWMLNAPTPRRSCPRSESSLVIVSGNVKASLTFPASRRCRRRSPSTYQPSSARS